MTFDKYSKSPEVPCGCGKDCGLTFRRGGMGQRTRKYAKGCPFYNVQRQELRHDKKEGADGRAGRIASRPSALLTHRTVKWCATCGGLPHRRPRRGCPPHPRGCGEHYAPDVLERFGIRREIP